jgi:prolipoprotein diacylglyceryltransferase
MEEKIKEYALNVLKGGEELTKTEMPIYVQEHLDFELYNYVVSFSLLLIAFSTFIFLGIIIPYKSRNTRDEEQGFITGFFFVGLSMIFFLCLIVKGNSLMKIKLAPRTYLVNKFTCTK